MPSKRSQNGARRPYHRHGHGAVTKAMPYLLERVADPALPDDQLTPLDAAARAWRTEAEQDLGGELAATKRAALDVAMGSFILLSSVERYTFGLAARGGLVNRRSRRAFPILETRMRLADSFMKQLQALGLERKPKPPGAALEEYLQRRYGDRQAGEAAP